MKAVFKNFLKRSLNVDVLKIHPIETKAERIYERYREYTMIPESIYISNLKLIYDFRHVNGCVVECGVWRGGMSAGMAEVLNEREFYLFDSFEGLPPAKDIDGERALKWQSNTTGPEYYDNCKAEMKFAETAMRQTNARYHLIKGWFRETLAATDLNGPIAVLRLDSDWYDSTMDCLSHLFDKVSKGGIIILDDYYVFDGCRRAVHDFLSSRKDVSCMCQYNNSISYIVKE